MGRAAPFWETYHPPGVRADDRSPRLSAPGLASGILKEHAGRTAFLYRAAQISYDKLGQAVAQVANAPRARGHAPGETVALYWQRPDEDARSFVDARSLVDGQPSDRRHRLSGRRWLCLPRVPREGPHHLLGHNVYPGPIEEAIIEHPYVAEVRVIGVPDPYRGEAAMTFYRGEAAMTFYRGEAAMTFYRGEAAMAFVVLHPGVLHPGAAEFSLGTLRNFPEPRLGKHEMPAALAFRIELPRTGVGKYSRKLLRDQELKPQA